MNERDLSRSHEPTAPINTSATLPKGATVRAVGLFGQGPREARVLGGKGIIRCLAIQATNGHHPDTGDTYVDEITHVLVNGAWVPFVLTPAHAKKLAAIRAFLD